jgi:hypothetical protein
MAKSFVEFRGYGFWSDDAFLEVWVYHFVTEVEKFDKVHPDWLLKLKQHWFKMATVGMLGTIELSLDHYVSDEKRRLMLLELAKKTNHFFYIQGDVLPLELANKPYDSKNGFLEPPQTKWFLKVGVFFIRLLRGKLPYKASGPFDYLEYENWGKL